MRFDVQTEEDLVALRARLNGPNQNSIRDSKSRPTPLDKVAFQRHRR